MPKGVQANIFASAYEKLRFEKESMLKQRARVLWMSGLSGAGKSTQAGAISARL
jgi:adenylylsulfate kinase-like enzyme